MMVFGICGMIGELIVKLMRGNIDAFAIWAVVAVCGAIRRAR